MNSDRLYKLYNNTQLTEAQDSGLDIMLGDIMIASIGQADDWVKYTEHKPKIRELVSGGVEHEEKWVPDMQLLLDPTVCPSVIIAAQQNGTGIYCHLLYLSRTWCHMLHTRRMKLLKLLNVV